MLIHAAKWLPESSSSAGSWTSSASSGSLSRSGPESGSGSGSSGISSCLRHCSTSLVPRVRRRQLNGEKDIRTELRQWPTAHDNWMQAKPNPPKITQPKQPSTHCELLSPSTARKSHVQRAKITRSCQILTKGLWCVFLVKARWWVPNDFLFECWDFSIHKSPSIYIYAWKC